MAQIQAAAMQVQMGTLHRNGDATAGGIGVVKPAAVPLQRGPQIANGVAGIAWVLGRQTVMLQKLVEAAAGGAIAGFAAGDGGVAALLAHAQLGGHGDHQRRPLQLGPNANDGGRRQAPLTLQALHQLLHLILQWGTRNSLQIGRIHRHSHGRGLSAEAHIGEMGAAIAAAQGPDATVAGLAFPNGGVAGVVAQKRQLTVVEAGGGAQPEHISGQGNGLQGEVFVHIPLNQIGDGVGNPELTGRAGGRRLRRRRHRWRR